MDDNYAKEKSYDRRVTPVRPDLAARHLDRIIAAPRYVEAVTMVIGAPLTALRRTPSEEGSRETELLYGESFALYDQADGWGWGQSLFDQYVGYVKLDALAEAAAPVTHQVSALRTYRYKEPDIKSPILSLISMNSPICAVLAGEVPLDSKGAFIKEARGGYIISRHLALTETLAEQASDFVAIAEKFLGTPYLWGGRSSLGLDCSALLQTAFAVTGTIIPRDSDQQQRFWATREGAHLLFTAKPGADDWRALCLERGDLLYWAGHAAIMTSKTHMIHANATQMAVSLDDARDFTSNIASEAGGLVAIFRPEKRHI